MKSRVNFHNLSKHGYATGKIYVPAAAIAETISITVFKGFLKLLCDI